MSLYETKLTDGTCEFCQASFQYERWVFDETCCKECQPARDLKWAEEAEVERISKEKEEKAAHVVKVSAFWDDMIPPRIADSDLSHPEFRKGLHEKASQWRPSKAKPWLGIVGLKGCCKTRIAVLRLKQAMIDEEHIDRRDYEMHGWHSGPSLKSPFFITSYEFSRSVVDQYSKEKSESKKAKEILQNANSAKWLVFDDLGKAKATPAVVSTLFALIDHRHSYNMPTIWTANSTPEEFCEGMPEDVAGPLVRRLKEASTLFAIA